jgi:hypothetical protein
MKREERREKREELEFNLISQRSGLSSLLFKSEKKN